MQEKPEAYFIPRRLARIDKVYRTAYGGAAAGAEEHLLRHARPAEAVAAGAERPAAGRSALDRRCGEYRVELHWPESVPEIPSPGSVEVRVYPTSFGWFGWTVDKILNNPDMSADRRTGRTERSGCENGLGLQRRVDAATEMVAVFCDDPATARSDRSRKAAVAPNIRVTRSERWGTWKRIDLEMEWGFQPGTETADFDGRLESHVAIVGADRPLADDQARRSIGARWQSRAAGDARRGIACPCCTPPTVVRVWTAGSPCGRRRPVSRSAARSGETADPDSGTRRLRRQGRQRDDRPAIRRTNWRPRISRAFAR